MPDTLQFWLTAFTSILFVVNPPAVVPAYLALTSSVPRARRGRLALATGLWTGGILLAFALAGTFILRLYGVTISAFRVGGGLILLVVALDMLRARRSVHGSAEEVALAASGRPAPPSERERTARDAVLTPLATPMLAGPGAITTVMVLMGQTHNAWQALPVFLSIAFTTLATWWAMKAAEQLARFLGQSGERALTRLLGLMLGALGMQLIMDGLREAGFAAARMAA